MASWVATELAWWPASALEPLLAGNRRRLRRGIRARCRGIRPTAGWPVRSRPEGGHRPGEVVERHSGDEVVVAKRYGTVAGATVGAADQGDVDVAVLHGAGTD